MRILSRKASVHPNASAKGRVQLLSPQAPFRSTWWAGGEDKTGLRMASWGYETKDRDGRQINRFHHSALGTGLPRLTLMMHVMSASSEDARVSFSRGAMA